MKVVGQINTNHDASGTGIDRDVVGGVIEELGTSVSINVVRVEIAPSELDIKPVLGGAGAIVDFTRISALPRKR